MPLSSPKNSNRNPVFLFQVLDRQAILLPYPTIPRPTALHVVSGETAVGVASPEVQRSAQFDAVVETVHKGFRKCRSARRTAYRRLQVAVEGESQIRGVAAVTHIVGFRVV